jgi:hypothetical protein
VKAAEGVDVEDGPRSQNLKSMLTARLEIRLPNKGDRERFVRIFSDSAFKVFSGGFLDYEAANQRFDRMFE